MLQERLEELLGQMTIEEKVSMLAGTNWWFTVPVERLGVPSLKMTDGPNGARGEGGKSAVCFPAGISLASTWNTALIERVGQALAQEARSKGALVLLAPTVNIQRTPLGGRNFETFSEDPYLTARLAVAYIRGVQSQGVGASVKHYVCNDEEFERYSLSVEVRERALREIYLPPFRAAVREAGTWTVMAAYNNVNGIPASEHPYLLREILRDEWGFEGVVMSDWFFSVKSTVDSVKAGLDLEMPLPQWRAEQLEQAVERGEVAEATLDESVRRLLQLLNRAGIFEHPGIEQEQAVDLPEQRALVREAASEGIVLLKNEGQALPLRREQITSIAVIGPNAKVAQIMGGGSARVNAHYAISPFQGIRSAAGEGIQLRYAPGCANHKLLPLFDIGTLLAGSEGNEHGLLVEYFNGDRPSGEAAWREVARSTELHWSSKLPGDVDVTRFAVRATARFTPQETGAYTLGLASAGLSRLYIDGREVIDNWTKQVRGDTYYGAGSTEVQATEQFEAGRVYVLLLEFAGSAPMAAVHLGGLQELPPDAIERAAALAADSDVALVCVGTSGEWESEGADKESMELPGQQDTLIERVAAANPRTIVVLNTGSPVAMPWLDKVAAVVQAWFPGQECGNAIADVLFGETNPSGRLAQTFPVRLEDTPAYLNFPGENGRVYYGEGLFVGYRYYDKKKIAPLFPFGFGLSYTTYDFSNLRLSAHEIGPDDMLTLSIDVKNTGERAGKEVVQVYVRDVAARLQRPEQELKAFAKVALAPGERQTVTLTLDREALAYYDDQARMWVAEAGKFEARVGSSSRHIHASASFTLTSTSRWRD
jgi:beta-glucosidase